MPGVRVQRISQFNLTVGAIMGRLDLFLLLAVALALLVGGVGIANTMLMSTSERYVEFGVMRTNGWTRRNMLALVTAESALLGLLSGLLGAGLATAGVLTRQPLPRWILARTEPLADRREPRGRARDRDALGPLPRVEGVADDPDGRDPTQRDLGDIGDAGGAHRSPHPTGTATRASRHAPVPFGGLAVMIEAIDVRKTFQSGDEVVEALRGVTFQLPTGSCTFIVGPSGSGKSTLLYLLAALDLPTSGTIRVADQAITSMPEAEQRRLPTQPGRVHLPVVQPDRQPHRGRQRAAPLHPDRHHPRAPVEGGTACSRKSAWATG